MRRSEIPFYGVVLVKALIRKKFFVNAQFIEVEILLTCCFFSRNASHNTKGEFAGNKIC